MTLPISPSPLSLSQVNVELGRSASTPINMNSTIVRTLFGIGEVGTTINMGSGRGKANKFIATISSDQVNFDLRSWLIAVGWDQSRTVEVTNNASIYATSTGVYALYITGSFPGGITFINNGNIIGKGGDGGGGGYIRNTDCTAASVVGQATNGGPAMYVETAVTITNNGIIGGGGGGGGNGGAGVHFAPPSACAPPPSFAYSAGGGGGGGAGYGNGGSWNMFTPGMGEAALVLSCIGSGSKYASYRGAGGSLLSAGAGGAGGPAGSNPCSVYAYGGVGGAGGSLGSSGATGVTGLIYIGSTPNTAGVGTAGGSGGAAVVGNGYISWNATGARYGAIS